jgi:hypothetical protein
MCILADSNSRGGPTLHRVDDRKSGIDTEGLLIVAVERRLSMRDFNALVRAAYIEALEFGGDPDEAFETALNLSMKQNPTLTAMTLAG